MTGAATRAVLNLLAARAQELLGDGDWHGYEQIGSELGKVIPPSVALRKNEAQRLASWRQRHPGADPKDMPPRINGTDIEDNIASGRRAMVRDFLGNTRVFQTNYKGQPGAARPDPDRKIRMIAELRKRSDDVLRDRIDQLEIELEQVRGVVAILEDWFVGNNMEGAWEMLLKKAEAQE